MCGTGGSAHCAQSGEMERQDGPGDASGLDDFIGKAALRYGLEESDIRIVEPDD